MNPGDFNIIATNTVVMRAIFRCLHLEDQLKFAQVSQQLQYFFRTVIWDVDYEKVTIIKEHPYYHIHNETNIKRLRLSTHEFSEFLKIYGPDIKELYEICNPCLDLRKLPNLTVLIYSDLCLTKPQLQNVAKYCKGLEKLTILNCSNIRRGIFRMPQDFEIKTVLQMKKLKWLWVASSRLMTMKYKHFQQLVLKSNIKHLNLRYHIEPVKRFPKIDPRFCNTLEELEIFTTFRRLYWGKNLFRFLKHFENLLILTIRMEDNIYNDTLIVLSQNCKQLKKLSINSTTFTNVSNFILLTSLEELNIHSCIGLTHSNLREILSEMNLLRFSTLLTNYSGIFENFPISQKLQSLTICIFRKCEFKTIYEEDNNLQTLIWDDDYYDTEKPPLILNCKHLEKLDIISGAIELENVMQLTSLRSFSLDSPPANFSWSFIIQLLQHHVSLTQFTLQHVGSALYADIAPDEAFECAPNIKCIKISPSVFELSIDFWLDLLGKNRQIKLNCFGIITPHFVRSLLNSSKFPPFVRILYINGFKVACKSLRRNFTYLMEQIEWETKHPQEASYNNNYGIIF